MLALEDTIQFLETAYGYKMRQNIYTGPETLIYRAWDNKEDRPVVIKIMRSEYPSMEQLKKFEREFSINRELGIMGIVKAYKLLSLKKTKAIIMEDFGGISLEKMDIAGKLSIKEFLVLAMRITGILQQVHSQYIVHKDLKPHNILMNPNNSQLKLIDFGMAFRLSKEAPETLEEKMYEGTFHYMPPEQAQTLHEPIDFRADLYSLGITLYELLTGETPFNYERKEQLVHAHAARVPRRPETIRPAIPPALSAVILKLIEKIPARRYQSCRGLMLDLEKCLRHLSMAGKIENFIPGANDIPMIFYIPEKLYARESELTVALAVYENLTCENKKSMIIHGEPGIGKSVLVREIQKEIIRKKGYFVSGKFEQSKQMSPYSAIIEAVTAIVDHLMVEPDVRFKIYKEKILRSLGAGASVISKMIPHMEIITGPLPEAPPLPPEQTKNRLHMAFQKFLSIASELPHPLTLFIDDLQWADRASLELIQQILTDPEITHLLFIGTYRDDKIDKKEPLSRLLRELKETRESVMLIPLLPLVGSNITQMVTDTFYCSSPKAARLKNILLHKTGGNPFYIKLFLKTLYIDGLIRFEGKWVWDINKIKLKTATSNVVTHLQQSMKKLESHTLEALKMASCYGNSFNIEEFGRLIHKPKEKFLPFLLPAIERGYLIIDDRKVVFVHDKIREAAYNLISEEMQIYLHYRIGNAMINKEHRGIQESFFLKINHLNKALPILTEEEKEKLLPMNIQAGKQAKAAGAFDGAETFFLAGRKLLTEESWNSNYFATLDLLIELAETRIALAEYEKIEELFLEITANARTIEDKTKITALQVFCFTALNQPEKALSAGLNTLKDFGFTFRMNPSEQNVADLFKKMEKQIRKTNLKEFFNRTILTGNVLSHVCMIIKAMSTPLFQTAPLLFTEIHLTALKWHLEKKELCELSLYIMSSYGTICMGYNKKDTALYITEALDANLNRFHNNIEKAQYLFLKMGTVFRAKHPLEVMEDYKKALQTALAAGDNEFASTAYFNMFISYIMSGTSLDDIKKWSETHFNGIKKLKYKWMISHFSLYNQGIANLLGEAEDFSLLKGEFYDELLELEDPANQSNVNCHFYYTFMKVMLLYLSENTEPCLPLIEKLEKNELSFASQPFYTSAKLLFALVISRLCDRESHKKKKTALLKKLELYHKKLEFFARRFDDIHGSKYRLVTAELYRLQKKSHEEIMNLYDQSIAGACQNEYTYEAAMANECAAEYLFSRNERNNARFYLKEAVYFYNRWGCAAKVKQLENKYGIDPYEVIKNGIK